MWGGVSAANAGGPYDPELANVSLSVWREDLGLRRLYVTNAPASRLALQHVSAVYALRREIELLFPELKTLYRIEQMPSGRRGATECLLYAALLALALSRRLQKLVTGAESSALSPNPPERWSQRLASSRRAKARLIGVFASVACASAARPAAVSTPRSGMSGVTGRGRWRMVWLGRVIRSRDNEHSGAAVAVVGAARRILLVVGTPSGMSHAADGRADDSRKIAR
jgi:hypothetical protein